MNDVRNFLANNYYFDNWVPQTNLNLDRENVNIDQYHSLCINVGNADYIPYCFLDISLFDLDLHGIYKYNNKAILKQKSANSIRNAIDEYIHDPNYSKKHPLLYDLGYPMHITIGQSIVMHDGDIIFCLCIDSEFITDRIENFINELSQGAFYSLIDEKGYGNIDDIKNIISVKTRDYLNSIDELHIFENSTLFINEQRLEEIGFLDYFSLQGSVYSKIEVISESNSKWFNSKILSKPEMINFSDIDGPEEYAKRALGIAV